MKLSEMFRQPINKDDIMPVIRQGIFMSIVGGLLIGSIQLLFYYLFDFSFLWLMLIVFAHLLAKRVRNAYQQYHLLYSIISLFFFIFGYYLFNVSFYIGLFSLQTTLSLDQILYMMNPLLTFQFLNPFTSYFFGVNNLLDVIFFLIGSFYAFRYAK